MILIAIPWSIPMLILMLIPICLIIDFSHSHALNSEPDLDLIRFPFRYRIRSCSCPKSDFSITYHSDSSNAVNRNFSPTLDLYLGLVLDFDPPGLNLDPAPRLVYDLDCSTGHGPHLDPNLLYIHACGAASELCIILNRTGI
ncbi:hypothetical protein EVAR_31223_1 [Eumeta japonica]|uniref:Uncharacterized protein n=1 Tax=Eumeta variegata TaxID=151549 RepID=A0A4C1W0E9_EUMVA|nr:hypothetical protein EVAR_31223_1 [Eumeta japonica]